jgi:hypothetical protein
LTWLYGGVLGTDARSLKSARTRIEQGKMRSGMIAGI